MIGRAAGAPVRVHAAPGSAALARLTAAEEKGGDAWCKAVAAEVGWGPGQAWPVGQDAAWAASLARRFVTVGGIVQAVEQAIDEGPTPPGDSGRWPKARRSPGRTARAIRSCRGR